jgi:predicted alpha/beta superfamily hydrolase
MKALKLVLAALAVFAAPVALAKPTRDAAAPKPEVQAAAAVTVPASRRLDLVSSVNGRRYTAFVAMPLSSAPPPVKGYPVLYVLDGNSLFGTAVDAARTFVKSGVVVVGIGYPLDDPALTGPASGLPTNSDKEKIAAGGRAGELWRNHDLTLSATEEFVRLRPGFGITTANVGGADDFLETIERDIKPAVANLVAIDAGNQALFGHSFGGLTVVRALMTRTNQYRTFIAASPSLYWNSDSVLRDEPDFAARVRNGAAQPRVLVTVGGEESTPPAGANEQTLAGFRLRRTLENARDFGGRLGAMSGSGGYRARFVEFAGEGHVSVQQASISRGVRFAFGD